MGSYSTVAITQEQFDEIIATMRTGSTFFYPNSQIAMALTVQANTGLRIVDVLQMTLSSIVLDGGRVRQNLQEQKTHLDRTFEVTLEMKEYIERYCEKRGISDPHEPIFKIKTRAVQKYLKKVVEYLGYENAEYISTHSFRKFYAMRAYVESGCDIRAVQTLLQHSSPLITQRYLSISDPRITQLSKDIIHLPSDL